MKKAFISLFLALLLTACGSLTAEDQPSAGPIVLPTSTSEPTEIPAPEEAVPAEQTSGEEDSAGEATTGPDCLGSDVNELGQGIADRFEGATYEEVMTWFCNGAEFEDILLALQSAQQSDASVEEMLVMLADDFTWDEIWQLLGITE